MIGMAMADQDEICLYFADIYGFCQLIMRNKGVKQEFFPVYLNAEAGMAIISELHENPDFVRMANLIVRHHFREQYINIGRYIP
jgi:hypothetical protein